MKLAHYQLEKHLKQALSPIYIISGDEPLLVQESIDTIRRKCRSFERVSYQITNNFDWSTWSGESNTLSLFNDRRLLELHFKQKPNDAAKKTLLSYIEQPSSDNVLIISLPKLDAATQKTKWFTAIEQAACFMQIWPIDAARFPQWLNDRLKQAKLNTDAEGIRLLATFTEGNLLAAAQEIEKLTLLFPNKTLSTQEIASSVHNNSRFDVFKLVDAILLGKSQRTYKILQGLREESIEPTLILWAIARELQTLKAMTTELKTSSINQVLASFKVWEKRKPFVSAALQRLTIDNVTVLLSNAAKIDRVIKGVEKGNVWDLFTDLCLHFAGNPLTLFGYPAGKAA